MHNTKGSQLCVGTTWCKISQVEPNRPFIFRRTVMMMTAANTDNVHQLLNVETVLIRWFCGRLVFSILHMAPRQMTGEKRRLHTVHCSSVHMGYFMHVVSVFPERNVAQRKENGAFGDCVVCCLRFWRDILEISMWARKSSHLDLGSALVVDLEEIAKSALSETPAGYKFLSGAVNRLGIWTTDVLGPSRPLSADQSSTET